MQVLITVLAIIAVAIIILIYLSNYAYRMALSRESNSLVSGRRAYDSYPKTKWFEQNAGKEEMTSDDGLKLIGFFCDHGTDKFAVLCHGYRDTHRLCEPAAAFFYNNGFGVLAPDARGHGESEGAYIGMGWHERRDVVKWCRKLIEDHGSDIQIVLYGISMGAATVMMAGGEPDLPSNVKCIVEDCGFSSIWEQTTGLLKRTYSLPPFPILYMASNVCKRKAGYRLQDGDVEEQLKKCSIPVLFIHGDKDALVPFYMQDKLYQAAAGPKEKIVFNGAGHALSLVKDPDRYFNGIKEFTEKYIC